MQNDMIMMHQRCDELHKFREIRNNIYEQLKIR